jgi:succinate dehydrogenase flavin-adding protein (antitoxin of CptAB toxin-antitoxin module)
MISLFIEEKLDAIMSLYNDTYRDILADSEQDIFNWSERVIENSYHFQFS